VLHDTAIRSDAGFADAIRSLSAGCSDARSGNHCSNVADANTIANALTGAHAVANAIPGRFDDPAAVDIGARSARHAARPCTKLPSATTHLHTAWWCSDATSFVDQPSAEFRYNSKSCAEW
jgi:hypothetical protein